MSREPQTVRADHPRTEEAEAEVVTREPIRTLLWTAATIRPLDEVAALVSLLRRTGEVPSPADEALKAAAVARPLDEVRQLVRMLNEPPEQLEEVDAALRAAAVGRPIEDVAELVSILGTEDAERARSDAAGAGLTRAAGVPVEAAGAPRATAPVPAVEPAVRAVAEEPPAAAAPETVRPKEHSLAAEPRAGTFRFVPPTASSQRPPESAEPRESAPARREPEGAVDARSARRPGAEAAPRAGRAGRAARKAPAETAPAAGVLQPLRSVLRWPAGAALLVMGLIHLPKDLAELRSGGYADAVSVLLTGLCLVLAVWLVVQDMVWTWGASAVAAATVLVVHSMVGFGSMTLPDSSLGGTYAWAHTVALVCAIGALALCGSALMRRRTDGVASDVQS
jgi:hypothetical protein